MAAPRRFDHDEARRRYAAGETRRALAAEYGVTTGAVYLATDWHARARGAARASEWQKLGRCPDCGAPATRLRFKEGVHQNRCVECSVAARATTVQPDSLQCVKCRRWKPDEEFPFNRADRRRRFRHSSCRGCQAALRQKSRMSRAVPCVSCGKPRLHPGDTHPRGNSVNTGLCLACYRAGLKSRV